MRYTYCYQRIIVEIEQVVLHSLTLISFDAIIAASHKISATYYVWNSLFDYWEENFLSHGFNLR